MKQKIIVQSQHAELVKEKKEYILLISKEKLNYKVEIQEKLMIMIPI